MDWIKEYQKLKLIKLLIESYEDTKNETYQAMEGFLHNLNTMHSRGGNQVVFSSINYGTDTSEEGRMVIRELLKATSSGLGKNETPIFPIQIFKVREGLNYSENDYDLARSDFDGILETVKKQKISYDDNSENKKSLFETPNFDLLLLSCETSSRRLFPNFVFLDSEFNRHEKWRMDDPERYKYEIATMGCRTRVFENVNGEKSSLGRGNLSFTSINFPRIAILTRKNVEKEIAEMEKNGKFANEETLENILKIAEYLPENMEYSFGKYRIRKGNVERSLGNTSFAGFSEALEQYLDESGKSRNFVFTATGSYTGDRLTYNPSSGLEFISREHVDLWENLEPKFCNLSKEMNTYLFARIARYEAMFENGQKIENIGTDPKRMKKQISREVLNEIRKALSKNKNIMILGKTGSGKETFNDFILDYFRDYGRLRKTISIKEIRKGKEIVQMIDIFFKPIYEKYIFGFNLSYDGILKERISVTEKAILKMKQYLSDPDIHYSNEKEKEKIIELLEKFVKNSLVIHLKKDEKKGYVQEIVSLPEYENK